MFFNFFFQGNDVRYLSDGNKITHCKEYLGDHVHCKPVLDMTKLRSVQNEYEMSDKLFLQTIENEKKRWNNAFEVGLSTTFMKLRLIEVAHNYNLKHISHLKKFSDANKAEQTWRYKHILRHVNYMSHDRATFDGNNDMKRNLNSDDRDTLAAYAVLHLKQLYLRLRIPKHETTIQQIVYKYVRKHDLLQALVDRLEKR